MSDLRSVLSRYESAAFAWGRLDCCLFVADVLKELHGVDYAAKWRGTYSTEFGAKRIVVRHGGVEGIARSAFGDMLPPESARDGDPVLLGRKLVERDSIGGALGICQDGQIVYLTERGLARAPLAAAAGCFRV